ncbi:MAG: Mut7-C RNAse domain-containing protein [Candidatus Bathyarchaeota archaeon]|nr:MAG: Mut7-C RNAse domain-containing protein [Candidatus Bathyarchaeota archaeon]
MKFIADGMLGKLTRWLRMLGHDVKYARSLNDGQIIEIAKNEHRILLTRDLELYRQATVQKINTFFVERATEAKKLANLARRFNLKLEFDVKVSRCPKCNTRIKSISKQRVTDRIPEATASYYDEFWECPGCEKIYWQGAHWNRIQATLREARESLTK